MFQAHRGEFPAEVDRSIDEMTKISKALRRDRELAFYGSEDLTPSDFYTREDAETALTQALWVHAAVTEAVAEDR